jgi:hypothetical protein
MGKTTMLQEVSRIVERCPPARQPLARTSVLGAIQVGVGGLPCDPVPR